MMRLSMLMLVALNCVCAFARRYPAKPIRVIIPASPGDSCDFPSRPLGHKVSERLGQQLTIDNPPGAGGHETVHGYTSGGWFGFIAPAELPKELVRLLKRQMNRAMMIADVRERMTAFGLQTHTESPEFFTGTTAKDFATWGKLARDVGFQPR